MYRTCLLYTSMSAVKRIFKYLPAAFKDGSNEEARVQMSVAALEAGIAFNNACLLYTSLQAKYQGIHHEFVACAMAAGYAHSRYPDLKIGVMLCGGPASPKDSGPENVLAAVRHNQMEYFYSDVALRGYYPGYALRFFEDNGI